MKEPRVGPSLVAVDFDGTIVPDGASTVSPVVASSLSRLASWAHVAVVTARASERAVESAQRALVAAGLATLPLLVRDRARHDHTHLGLVASKRAAIAEHARRCGAFPEVGIGDRPSDETAYRALGMLVVRMRHASGVDDWSGAADLEVPVENGLLDSAWQDLPERIAALRKRR